MQEKEKLTLNFWSYYRKLKQEPQRELRKLILKNTNVEPTTFFSWLYKEKLPKWHTAKVLEAVYEFLKKQTSEDIVEIYKISFDKRAEVL